MAPGVGLRAFHFDRAFDMQASQRQVYEGCARAAVSDLFNGLSGCVLVYGQTGSGKTYTMFGEGSDDARLPHQLGVVPRACEEVVAALEARRAAGVDAELTMAYVEIFGSQVSAACRADGAPPPRGPGPSPLDLDPDR